MIGVAMAVAVSLQPFLLSPHDAHGWGLRIHNLSIGSPFLLGERIDQCRFRITLINFSDGPQLHDPLIVAYGTMDLDVVISGPAGKPLPTLCNDTRGRRDPFAVRAKMPGSDFSSFDFRFSMFGYHALVEPGRYHVEAKLLIDGKAILAPLIEFEVLGTKSETVLSSRTVPLEGWQAKLPPDEQSRPFIQQVTARDRTWLIYRRHHGPKDGSVIDGTYRLAELPGKCEMAVEGAYGDGRPLTITYKTAPDGQPTKLVIHSVDGMPWREEDEHNLQERRRREAGLPPVAPAPRPVRP